MHIKIPNYVWKWWKKCIKICDIDSGILTQAKYIENMMLYTLHPPPLQDEWMFNPISFHSGLSHTED